MISAKVFSYGVCSKSHTLHFKSKYFATYMVEVFEISSWYYYPSLMQDLMVRYTKKEIIPFVPKWLSTILLIDYIVKNIIKKGFIFYITRINEEHYMCSLQPK